LGPDELRQSQYDELEAHGFGALGVVDASEARKRPLGRDEMTDADFDRLAHAWLAIDAGKGMNLQGDAESLKQMIARGLGDSPALRGLVTELGESGAAPFDVALGHSQPGTFIDSFTTKAVDLDDLAALPSARDPVRAPNAVTREEQIVHV